jgi:hypothetical protein
MFLPRSGRASATYHRRKLIFAAVTFVVVWLGIRWFAPDLQERLRALGTRTPGGAFRDRISGEAVETRAVVEDALGDSTDAAGEVIARWRMRSLADHPFTLLARKGEFGGAAGDTVRVRGIYVWDTRGGVVSGLDEGWIRPARSR